MSIIAEIPAQIADLALIVALWLLAVIFLHAGYTAGGTAWRDWFDKEPIDRGARISGREVETIMVTLTAALLAFVNQLTPALPIAGTLVQHWPLALGLVGVGFGVVWFHSRTVVATVEHQRGGRQDFDEFKRELARGYRWYNGFSTIIFTFYVVAAIAVVFQLRADNEAYQTIQAELDQSLHMIRTWRFASTNALVVSLEEANSLLVQAIHGITEQINTVLLLFFFALVVNFVVALTPVGAAYTDDGLRYTYAITALVFTFVIGFGWYLYYNEYLVLIRSMISELSSSEVRSRVVATDWQVAQRYFELMNELRGKQGLTGFAITMSSERGGVLLLASAVGGLYQLLSKSKD